MSQKVKSLTYYFHMKTKILADFQICISVLLRSITGCLICFGYFFRFTFTIYLLFLLTFLKIDWTLILRILDLSVLLTIKNDASGHTLCCLQNSFLILYVCLKIVTRKYVVSPIKENTEKNTTLNTKGLKKGTKKINMRLAQIFHFT